MAKPTLNQQYIELIRNVLNEGFLSDDRTGVGTLRQFGAQLQHDMADGFPLITAKQVAWKRAFGEMLWMLSGSSSIVPLLKQNNHIWSDWPHKQYCEATGNDIGIGDFEKLIISDPSFAEQWGDLGPVYGKQWRGWRHERDGKVTIIDQVQRAIDTIRNEPDSRRIIVEGWNVGELDEMALPPCHKTYQFIVMGDRLNCHLSMRSSDAFLGLPFNLANLGLLTTLMAGVAGLKPGVIQWTGVDVHLYLNHRDVAEKLVEYGSQESNQHALPTLVIGDDIDSLFDVTLDDLAIEGYEHGPKLSAPVAV